MSISLLSVPVMAELTLLDDGNLSRVTGMAGLTIDLETKRSIGEFAYQDGGYFLFKNITFGGSDSPEELAFSGGHGYYDNRRMNIDIAGDGSSGTLNSDNVLAFGFSDRIDLAQVHVANGNTDADMLLAAGISTGIAVDPLNGLLIDTKRTLGDGDLLMHRTYTDAWQKGGGYNAYANTGLGDDGGGGTASLETLSYAALSDIVHRAVDFNISIDALGVAASDYEVGSGGLEIYLNAQTGEFNGTDHINGLDPTADTTVLISGLNINGYSGSHHLRNFD